MGKCTSKPPGIDSAGSVQKKHGSGINSSNFVQVRTENILEFYRIQGKISEGSFGSVYAIKHLKTTQKRAVKLIPIDENSDTSIEGILQEVSILKKMNHANIIRIFEVFRDRSHLKIVTEFCKGGELFDRILANSYFSESLAAKYMYQIVSAVVYMHSNNIVHRDLKPENLVFENKQEDSNLKLIDFGVSKHFKKNEILLERVGSPYYIAPEVISGNYDEKCDVWSLGVILYIMLSGRPAFTGKNETEILVSIMTKEPSFDGSVWRNISKEAIELIKSMLVKNSANRIPASQVIRSLWLQKYYKNIDLDKNVASLSLRNLSRFNTTSKLHRATISYIVSQVISSEEVEKLREVFRSIDKNGDGVLSPQELKDALNNFLGISTNAENLIKKIDADGNGDINYSEFLAAAIDWEKELSKERLQSAFNLFDKDSNGSISVKELTEALGGNRKKDNMFLEMIQEADINHDGEIDLEEFCNFMRNGITH
jgi:calcium-dependent protein kinase